MSKRIKLIDWTPVLKLVLLVGDLTDNWSLIPRYCIISREIQRYIKDQLVLSAIVSLHATFVDHEHTMFRKRSWMPRPLVLKFNEHVCIASIGLPIGQEVDVMFFSIFADNELLVDTSLSPNSDYAPCTPAQSHSYIKVRTKTKDGTINIYGAFFDMNVEGCRKCQRFKNSCECRE